MTRKPRKTARKSRKARAVRKPVRTKKAAAKPAKTQAKKQTKKQTKRDPLDDFIAAGARALDLKIQKPWLPMVRTHLKIILQHGGRVAAFTLSDEAEPAPVYRA